MNLILNTKWQNLILNKNKNILNRSNRQIFETIEIKQDKSIYYAFSAKSNLNETTLQNFEQTIENLLQKCREQHIKKISLANKNLESDNFRYKEAYKVLHRLSMNHPTKIVIHEYQEEQVIHHNQRSNVSTTTSRKTNKSILSLIIAVLLNVIFISGETNINGNFRYCTSSFTLPILN